MKHKKDNGYEMLIVVVAGCIGFCLLCLAAHYIGVGIAEALR